MKESWVRRYLSFLRFFFLVYLFIYLFIFLYLSFFFIRVIIYPADLVMVMILSRQTNYRHTN